MREGVFYGRIHIYYRLQSVRQKGAYMRKKKTTVTSLILALCIVFAPISLFSCSDGKVTLSVGASRILEWDPESGDAHLQQADKSGKTVFTLRNHSSESISVTVYSDAAEDGQITLSAKPGEKVRFSGSMTDMGHVNNGLRLQTDSGEDSTYIMEANGLTGSVADGGDITLLGDVEIDGDLIISAPCKISAGQKSLKINGAVSFEYGSSGTFEITGDISSTGFFSSAPNADIVIPENLVPDNIPFNVCARSLNSEKLSGKHLISSAEELNALCDDKSLPRLCIGDNVLLSGFDVESPVTFSVPVNIGAEDVHAAKNSLRIVTDIEGTVTVGDGIEDRSIYINAPNCDLQWEDCPYTADGIGRRFSVASFCNLSIADRTLGGSAHLPEEMFLAETDYGTVTWKLSDSEAFVYKATVDFAVPVSLLRSAPLETVSTKWDGETELQSSDEEGSGSIGYIPDAEFFDECSNEGKIDLLCPTGCYFTLTDEEGNRAVCRLDTEIGTRLPTVEINVFGGETITDREEYKNATVAIYGQPAGKTSIDLESTPVRIRGRGNSTWNFSDKKPYKLKFDTKVSVLGMEAAKKWVLLANYADKTLIRNSVALDIAKVLDNMECYASQYPVDLFVNGEYAGVYSIGQQIEAGDGRTYVKRSSSLVDSGFFLEVGGAEKGDEGEDTSSLSSRPDVISGTLTRNVQIKLPDESALTTKQATYIKNYVELADTAVSRLENYDNYIDVDALVDWFIMIELSFNSDSCFRRSVFMKKDAGGKLEMGPVWDFDLAFGGSIADYGQYESWACLNTQYHYVSTNWMTYLMRDDSFKAVLYERWQQVKEELLETAQGAVDSYSAMTAPSAENNFRIWDILGVGVTMEPDYTAYIATYDGQIQYLKSFIESRWQWMDEEISSYAGLISENG